MMSPNWEKEYKSRIINIYFDTISKTHSLKSYYKAVMILKELYPEGW